MRIDQTFTRQEMALLTGIADDVLAFWIKNGLLVASEGGVGKGSHRKFTGYQINIAGVLAELRSNGINIAGLRAFASELQRGTALCEKAECNFPSIAEAMELRRKIDAFKRHEHVIVGGIDNDRKLANSMQEIVEDFFYDPRHRYDTPQNIAAFADRIRTDDFDSIRLFEALNSFDRGEEWLAIRVSENEWKIHTTIQAGRSEAFEQGNHRSGLYLWVGRIVADIWGSRLEQPSYEILPLTDDEKARVAILEDRFERVAADAGRKHAAKVLLAAKSNAKKHGLEG